MAKVVRRLRARFYVLLFVVLAALGTLLFFLLGGARYGELTTGMIRLSYTAKAVIIRDEVSVPTERYDKVLFDVIEGAHVSNGDQIAQVFKWGYQEETMQALLDVQQEIQDYQLTLWEGIVNPTLDELTLQLQQKQEAIRTAMNSESSQDLLQLEMELKALMSDRMALLRDMQTNETLSALYEREQQQLDNLASWKRDIKNQEGDGVISFYFDGYEQVLSAGKLELLNAALLSTVLGGSGAETNSDSTTTATPLYRLINDVHFFIAFLTDKSVPFRLVEGETYTVVFAGYADRPFTATARAPIISEDKKVVNLLEFNQSMGDLTGVRLVDATIMKEASGLQVPLEAISIEGGVPIIQRIVGKDPVKVQVDVLATDENDAIIRSIKGEQELVVGLRYRKP